MPGPTQNLDQIGSAVLMFIVYKQTDRQAKYKHIVKTFHKKALSRKFYKQKKNVHVKLNHGPDSLKLCFLL